MLMVGLRDLLSIFSGTIVGLVLGLIGGGGSILAVPLLIYVVGVSSTHVALGTSAFAVGAAATVNLFLQRRIGNAKWPCAIVFSIAGVAGALAGVAVAKQINGDALLAAFGLLMIVVGAIMLRRRGETGNPDVRLVRANIFTLGPRLLAIGLGVGLLSGFFGIGGGFLIVPGLMLAAGMPIKNAVATSLVSVAAFGFTTAGSYAYSGQIDWRIALVFVAGGAVGGLIGKAISGAMHKHWSNSQMWLQIGFAIIVVAIGVSVVWRGIQVYLA